MMSYSFRFCWLPVLMGLLSCGPVLADGSGEDCPNTDEIGLWTSPARPGLNTPMKVMAVMTDGPADSLAVIDPEGNSLPLDARSHGGPPWSLEAPFSPSQPGDYRFEVRRGGAVAGCLRVSPGQGRELRGKSPAEGWTRPFEAYYSAWIERLFDGPIRENLGFTSLEPVLRDPARNFLHNHLGQNEDVRLPATPDCADLPYFLRTYFAWKIGLPMAFRACDRGTASRPPHCGPATIDERFTHGSVPVSSFTGLMRQIADTVHSGSGRTGLDDEATDFYPVALDRASLWPGTLYADPYGHTLIISQWVAQGAGGTGLLLAADAQPDNSVARKRFWEGNFLFANTPGAGPGFKAFRPILRDGDRFRLPNNTWLAVRAPVAAYSEQQDGLSPDDFYAAVAKVINPRGLAPEQVYDAMLDALVEQLETRVKAIDTGERYMSQHRGAVISMPSGAAIFETQGAWEDYATPSRDMRVLIALKVLAALPEQIVHYPALFELGGRSAEAARSDIEQRHQRQITDRRFSYTRSDGSSWDLSVADVYERRGALETGYNPNECIEARWGAPAGSSEYEPCQRHAPADQKARMMQYRAWFSKTQRPTR